MATRLVGSPIGGIAADVAGGGARVECATSSSEPQPKGADLEVPVGRDRERDSDDAASLDEESDFDLTGLDDDEEVGLDTSTGFEDADELELPEEGEGERWSNDSEEVGDLPGTDGDMFQGEEYGWIGDDEPSDDDEAFDTDLDDGLGDTSDDGGAEGLDDDSELDDLDLGDLPELDADSEEDASGGAIEGLEELAANALVEERSVEVAPGQIWRALAAQSTRVSVLTALREPPLALAAAGSRVVLCAGDLIAYDADSGSLQSLPLPTAAVTDLAVADHENSLLIALAASGQVWLSDDGGKSFAVQSLAENVTHVSFTRTSPEPRLWRSGDAGTLHAGDSARDLGGQVLQVQTDGARFVLALVRRHQRLELALSSDAGKTFAFQHAPESADAETRLAIVRGALLVQGTFGVRCAVFGQAFETFSGPPCVLAVLSDEEGQAFAYGCVRHRDEWLIVRRLVRADGTRGTAPMIVATLRSELVDEPRHMVVNYAEGGFVTIYLASDRSLLRVDASLDGEELA